MIDAATLIEDAETPVIGHNSLAELSGIVSEYTEKQKEISDLEAKLKTLNADIYKIEMTTLPDAMLSIGMEEFTTTEGAKITVKPIVSGSIPKKNEPKAFEWLRSHKHEDIIKRVVTLSFTKGQDKDADKVCKNLEKEGYAPVSKDSVHAGTLKSWAKEQLEAGKVLPLELLGIFHARKAKITLPKTQL
jgi:hypothetical protein